MSNTFGTGDPEYAMRLLLAHLFNTSLLAGGVPSWTGSTLTTDAFATTALTTNAARDERILVVQATAPIGPLDQGDGIYYIAVHRDIVSTVSPYTRQAGTHYLWQRTGTGALDTPTLDVDGEITLGALTVAGGEITAYAALTTVGLQLALPTLTRDSTQPGGDFADITFVRQGPGTREAALQWNRGGGVGNDPGRNALMQMFNDDGAGIFKIRSQGLPQAMPLALESSGFLRLQSHEFQPVIQVGSGTGVYRITSGTGSPEGVIQGSPPDLYLNASGGAGTTLYVKESGTNTTTGWVGK